MMNTAEAEGHVRGPSHWHVTKRYKFFGDAYNEIKPEMERLHRIEKNNNDLKKAANLADSSKKKNRIIELKKVEAELNRDYDLGVAQFVQKMIRESYQFLGNEEWTNIIGTEYWNILKLDEKGNDRYSLDDRNDLTAANKKKSVVYLFKLIRDKIEHIRTYSVAVKQALNSANGGQTKFFYQDRRGAYQLDVNQFIRFWTSKFPKIMSFLWLQFYTFKDQLAEYYPIEIKIGRLQPFVRDLKYFKDELECALSRDLEKEMVLNQFHGRGVLLEFRTFHNLSIALEQDLFITVKISLQDASLPKKEDKIILIFANIITDVNLWGKCFNCGCRVVVFGEPEKLTNEKIENAVILFENVNNFTLDLFESRIIRSELLIDKQDWVIEQGQICIDRRELKISSIFPNISNILVDQSGYFFSRLFIDEKAILSAAYKYPDFSEDVYVKRKLFLLSKIDAMGRFGLGMLFGYKRDTEQSFCENELLEKINSKSIKTIFLLATRGMGKSLILTNFGRKLENSLAVYCQFRHFVDSLQKQVGNGKCSKVDIKSVILDILGCKEACGRMILDKWLERKCYKGARIELQLDGLDELHSTKLHFALDALKIIQNDFDSIRLWLTSRHLLSNEWRGSEMIYLSICHFSESDRMKCLQQHFDRIHKICMHIDRVDASV